MAAMLEEAGRITLLESDDGLTIHLDADPATYGDVDAPSLDLGGYFASLMFAETMGFLSAGPGDHYHLTDAERRAVEAWAQAERDGTL